MRTAAVAASVKRKNKTKEEEKHASRPSQVSGSHGKDTATVPPAFNILRSVLCDSLEDTKSDFKKKKEGKKKPQ